MVPDIAAAFATAERIGQEEGRAFVHPYEGPLTARGTATIGLEWLEQAADLEAILVPVGGGGLIAGIACAVKQLNPACQVFGVEPFGADSIVAQHGRRQPPAPGAGRDHRRQPRRTLRASLQLRSVPPVRRRDRTHRRCRHDRCDAPGAPYVEAGAGAGRCCSRRALLGPLRERLAGRRVGVLVCGSNIDLTSFAGMIAG